MSRWHSYLNSAKELINTYNCTEPFPFFLKNYFSQRPKAGSSDRRTIAHCCYCYFRLSGIANGLDKDEAIFMGLFLCSISPDKMLEALKPEWKEKIHLPLSEKLQLLGLVDADATLFPALDKLSKDIDKKEFAFSHFVQPDLFLRVRPGKLEKVNRKLEEAGIKFDFRAFHTIGLENAVKLEGILVPDQDAVIQDLSSQRISEFLEIIKGRKDLRVWDCCAGSGGKSILAYDINPEIDLTVSDRRDSILHNLEKRFVSAGIKGYQLKNIDLLQETPEFPQPFDLIIADVPCSGSGTWGRNPEQLSCFRVEKMEEYANIQRLIVDNALPSLKPGGYFLYCTCSVYEKENEDISSYILEKENAQILEQKILNGYDAKADTMFACLIQKNY